MIRKTALLAIAAAALTAGCMVPGVYVSGGVGVGGGRGYVSGGIGGYSSYGYSRYRYPYGYRSYGNYGYGGNVPYGQYGYRAPLYRLPDGRWIRGYDGYRSAYPYYGRPGHPGISHRYPPGYGHGIPRPGPGPGPRPMPGTGVTVPTTPSAMPAPPATRPAVKTGGRRPAYKNVEPNEAVEP